MNNNATFPLAKSLAGRDKDVYHAVVKREDGIIYIADGRKHKLSAPKKKNAKHVMITDKTITLSYLTDRDLRRKLWEYNFGKHCFGRRS